MKISVGTPHFAGWRRRSDRQPPTPVPRRAPSTPASEPVEADRYDPLSDPFGGYVLNLEGTLRKESASRVAGWSFSPNSAAERKKAGEFLAGRFQADDLNALESHLKAYMDASSWRQAKPHYRALARVCHPDLPESPTDAEAIFKALGTLAKAKN